MRRHPSSTPSSASSPTPAPTGEAAGLLERAPNPDDGRSVIVRHTAAGWQILLDALDVMSAIEDDYARLVGQGDVAKLKRLLVGLLHRIDPQGRLDQA